MSKRNSGGLVIVLMTVFGVAGALAWGSRSDIVKQRETPSAAPLPTTHQTASRVSRIKRQTVPPADAVADFSPTNNPNGVWSYGFSTTRGSPFSLDPFHQIDVVPGVDDWSATGSGPFVLHNKSGVTKTYSGTIVHPTDLLNLDPSNDGRNAVVRWTAPAAGTYRVDGRFQGLDTGGTTTDVAVLHNSTTTLFSTNINGFGSQAPFSLTVTVAVGDQIDFSVGRGTSGSTNDSTGLAATITPAAPPNVVSNTNDSGPGSLREAINFANANPGTTISFHIPTSDPNFSGGVFTIKPTSPLPDLTANGTVIDGGTQTAFTGDTNAAGPEIVLNGGQLTSGSGLVINNAADCLVRGLVVNGFPDSGVNISGTGAQGNRVQGCFIGTNERGDAPVPNRGNGVLINGGAQNNTIGDANSGGGNVIAHNLLDGVRVADAATTGNRISGNSIHDNGRLGINLAGGVEDANGMTINDAGDADSGPNGLQNVPVITAAVSGSVRGMDFTEIKGMLDSAPNQTYTVELFASATPDPSGFGEGQVFLGFVETTTDATGRGTFRFATAGSPRLSAVNRRRGRTVKAATVVRRQPVPVGKFVSATATDTSGNTSEFSTSVPVTSFQQTITVTGTNNATTLLNALTQGSAGLNNLTASFTQGPLTSESAISAGTFTNSNGKLSSIPSGIVLSSGDVNQYADGPSLDEGTSTGYGAAGNAALDALAGQPTKDATIFRVEFDTSTTTNSVRIQFVFGSEEFPEFVGSSFNDVFAVFLNGTNVAFDQNGNLISINTVFFASGADTELDGNTVLLTLRAPVMPGSHNVLEIAIADAADDALDSTVYVSRLTGSPDVVGEPSTNPVVTVRNTNNSGPESLREALTVAAQQPGSLIAFNIPTSDPGFSGGVFTIRPASALPPISADGTVLDGSTQTSFTGDTNPVGPEIVLDGSLAGAMTDGLVITGSKATAQHLEIRSFGGAGVKVTGAMATQNRIASNSIHDNGKLGIDLVGGNEDTFGVTANDPGDADASPNKLQNFPVLNTASVSGSNTTVVGSIDSDAANAAYPITIEFFASPVGDPSGFGEGRTFLGSLSVNAPGPFAISTLPSVPVGQFITATATDNDSNTSEFSHNVVVTSSQVSTTTLVVDARANIFGAGHASPPAPGGGGAGLLPPGITFTRGQVLTFQSVTGSVSCCGGGSNSNGPDGGPFASGNTDILSTGGISGVIHSGKTMFLVGVFLDNSEPADPALPRLDFSPTALGDNFMTLAPQLRQVFFIGDGLTGTGAGNPQQFIVPAGATRLFLGFADALEFGNPTNPPGFYGDNVGSLNVQLAISQAGLAHLALGATPSVVDIGGQATIEVTALNAGGSPASNVSLDFEATGGTLSETSKMTDSNGKAAVTLSNVPPGGSRVTVRSGDVSAFVDVMSALRLPVPAGLSLICLPSDVPSSELANVFRSTTVDVARFNPNLRNGMGDYEFISQQAFDLISGEGYWIRSDTAQTAELRNSPPPNSSQPVIINLHRDLPGYVLKGNPTGRDLLWDAQRIRVHVDGQTVGTLAQVGGLENRNVRDVEPYCWFWNAEASPPRYALVVDLLTLTELALPSGINEMLATDRLEMGHGAFFFVQKPNVELEFSQELQQPHPAGSLAPRGRRRQPMKPSPDNWTVELRAQAGDAHAVGNVFGVTSRIPNGLQVKKAPAMMSEKFVDLTFENENGARLAWDVRTSATPKLTWDVVVTTNQSGEVSLTYPNLSAMPRSLRAYVVDPETGKRQSMRTTSQYVFHANGNGVTRKRLRIEICSLAPCGRLQLSGLQAAAAGNDAARLVRLSFVLNRTAQVQARVISPTGKVVRTFLSSTAQRGLNVVNWDGKSQTGGFAPRGLYVVEVLAADEEGEQVRAVKMVVLR